MFCTTVFVRVFDRNKEYSAEDIAQKKIHSFGKILFTNSIDGLFRLWDLQTGKLLAEPTAKQSQFTPASISPDGQTVALSASTAGRIALALAPELPRAAMPSM